MHRLNIGRLEIVFSTRTRWTRVLPDGTEAWHCEGIALAVVRHELWGQRVVSLLRIPLAPRTYAGEPGPW